MTAESQQLAVPLEVDVDECGGLEVYYEELGKHIAFSPQGAGYGRITFEKFDALRICRGEYPPVEFSDYRSFSWVAIVKNSTWLKERHAYESEHYSTSYEFGGDVDEMLRDFNHYLFTFHDEYIEVIAAGIWIDVTSEPLGKEELSANHPKRPLPREALVSQIEAHELVCEVRASSLDESILLKNAQLCSQPLLDFALLLDGHAKVGHRLSLRMRDGQPISVLKSSMGRIEAEFQGIVDFTLVRPYIESWMKVVRERRREMGK